jgi:hypothetical protein
MLEVLVAEVAVVRQLAPTTTTAGDVDVLPVKGGEPFNRVVAVVLTPEHGAEPVAAEVVRSRKVPEVFPFGDDVLEAAVVLEDLPNALRRDRCWTADR